MKSLGLIASLAILASVGLVLSGCNGGSPSGGPPGTTSGGSGGSNPGGGGGTPGGGGGTPGGGGGTPGGGGGTPGGGGGTPGGGGGGGTPAPAIYYTETFETGAPNFTQGNGGLLILGAPTGSVTAHGGTNVLGAGLTGAYPDGANEVALTPVIDLGQATDPVLVLWVSYDTESDFDGGQVGVATSANPVPTIVEPVTFYPGNVDALGDLGWSGSAATWAEQRFDLKAFAGQQINVVLKFASDSSVTGSHFFFDDVVLGEAAAVGGTGTTQPAGTVIYSEGFEGTPTTLAQAPTQWEFGAPNSGPLAAFAGQGVAATKLGGNYDDNVTGDRLKTPMLDFASATGGTLTFQQWYSFEQSFDGGRVLVTKDDVTFVAITPSSGYPGPVDALGGQPGFTGAAARYRAATFDLTPLFANAQVGRQFKIVFEFASDSSVTEPGWYIDDIAVYRQ